MVKERKIRCDCGSYLEEKETVLDNIKTKAIVCPNCNYTTLTKKQALDFMRLKRMHDLIDRERKVIKIGNSKGITLPEELNLKVGERVKTEALTHNSFRVVLKV